MAQCNGSLPRISSLATVVPEHRIPQKLVKEICRSYFQSLPKIDLFLPIFDHAEVEFRHFCFPPEYYLSPRDFETRNRDYLEKAIGLCMQGIQGVLRNEPVNSVDHVVCITTTGVQTPSLEAHLFNRAGLRSDIRRSPVFGIGCAGGVNSIALARDYALAHPDSRTLVISVELCGQTFQKGDFSAKNIVATSLFGDGVAVLLIDGAGRGTSGMTLLGNRSELIPDSLDVMGWEVTQNGLELVLSQKIDDYVRDYLPAIVKRFLDDNSVRFEDIDYFIFHPGGPKIMRAYEEVFPLPPDALRFTRHILRCYGNMSSASVLFILKDVLDRARPEPGQLGLMAAMGPGFAAELALLQF
jgi:alkylresorcinol/alkylpyrone synthase